MKKKRTFRYDQGSYKGGWWFGRKRSGLKSEKKDKDALVALILKRKEKFYRLAYALTENEEDAADAMGDMILVVYEKMH